MGTIRVAHVIQYLAIGGLERMVQALSQASQMHGIEPHVFAYLSDGPLRCELEQAGIATRVLHGRKGVDLLRPMSLGRYLVDNDIDVVHTHHLGPFLYGAVAALACGRPVVHTEHSHEFYDTPRRRALGYAMHRIARVVAVSQEISDFHAQRFHGTCTLIQNGVPIVTKPQPKRVARERIGIAPTAFTIGCVARLAQEKDHATLLQAFSRLEAVLPDSQLVLVGDGPLRTPLAQRVAELGLSSKVRFLGARSDVASILPAFDCVALTSVREGLPLALLEAMSHGLAVVASAVGGVPALLEDNAGLLGQAGDSNSFFQHFFALAESEKMRGILGSKARTRIVERYAMADTARRYAQIYSDVKNGSHETRRDSDAHRTADCTGPTGRSGKSRPRGLNWLGQGRT